MLFTWNSRAKIFAESKTESFSENPVLNIAASRKLKISHQKTVSPMTSFKLIRKRTKLRSNNKHDIAKSLCLKESSLFFQELQHFHKHLQTCYLFWTHPFVGLSVTLKLKSHVNILRITGLTPMWIKTSILIANFMGLLDILKVLGRRRKIPPQTQPLHLSEAICWSREASWL